MAEGPPNYCDDGMLLKFGGEQNVLWLRVILYLFLLGWSFMGVAIIADVFMVAIERITSKKKRRWNAEKHRFVTVTVWNSTVANLTLMALGSSAPEIMINVLELFRDNFYNGPKGKTPLGPSTIVGSAAFNLFIIVGVCVSVIPNGEVRSIKEFPVYVLTAVFSIAAYAWLLVILILNTPHIVEPWEGIFTFLLFPVLVASAYYVDRQFNQEALDKLGEVAPAEMTQEELAELETRIRKEHGADLSEDQVAKFVQVVCGEGSSRAKYRIAATRNMFGSQRVKMNAVERSISGLARFARTMTAVTGGKKQANGTNPPCGFKQVLPVDSTDTKPCDKSSAVKTAGVEEAQGIFIEFSEMKKAVLENAGCVVAVVVRSGNLTVPCSVDYKTRNGTAHSPSDYVDAEGTLLFGPNETTKTIEVSIVDDFSYEENEEFYIDLFNERIEIGKAAGSGAEGQLVLDVAPPKIRLGENHTITIVIVDDDVPGTIAFPEDEIRVPERVVDYEVALVVMRKHGSTGKVSCQFRTEDDTAIAGIDYDQLEGTLEFANQEMEHTIRVNIHAKGRYDRSERFRVVLLGPIKGGAKFDAETDGGADCCILTVMIESEKVAKDRIDRLQNTLLQKWDKAKIGHSSWGEQFKCAFFVNGGEEDAEEEDQGDPSVMDYAMHVITVPWKVLFAFCPPPDYCGGWISFVAALVFIGLVTALISDLANVLGCVLDLCPMITALTFVALGTSLPDTFASKTAAIQDPYADASIVNVTGSNSVNVFLGLGLPWMLGSFKWAWSGRNEEWDARYGDDEQIDLAVRQGNGAFIVKAGDLGFSVAVFTTGAFACIGILALRRYLYGAELGGPRIAKYGSTALLMGLWVVYVSLSSWKAHEGAC